MTHTKNTFCACSRRQKADHRKQIVASLRDSCFNVKLLVQLAPLNSLSSVFCLLSSEHTKNTSIFCMRRVPPFGYLRITAHLPAPRSFSQAITSFFASDCQGIHRLRFSSWSLLYNKLLKISYPEDR